MATGETRTVSPPKSVPSTPVQKKQGGGDAGTMELGLWANEQAVISSIILFFGGILGVAGMFEYWQYAAAAIPGSFVVFLMEWPRGTRSNGKRTVPRSFQTRLTVIVKNIRPLKNYYVRTVIMIIVSVPSCFLLPTILGGLCLIISSLIYLAAAINKEEWKPVQTSNRSKDAPDIVPPPPNPPPRNPASRQEFCVEVTGDSEKNRY